MNFLCSAKGSRVLQIWKRTTYKEEEVLCLWGLFNFDPRRWPWRSRLWARDAMGWTYSWKLADKKSTSKEHFGWIRLFGNPSLQLKPLSLCHGILIYCREIHDIKEKFVGAGQQRYIQLLFCSRMATTNFYMWKILIPIPFKNYPVSVSGLKQAVPQPFR